MTTVLPVRSITQLSARTCPGSYPRRHDPGRSPRLLPGQARRMGGHPLGGRCRREGRPKIFAFVGSPGGDTVGLKCAATRDEANEWLDRFPDDATVMPYIGRSGWNSLRLDAAIHDPDLLEAIDFSYTWVVSRLRKRDRPPQALTQVGRTRLGLASEFPQAAKLAPVEAAYARFVAPHVVRQPTGLELDRVERPRRPASASTWSPLRPTSMPSMSIERRAVSSIHRRSPADGPARLSTRRFVPGSGPRIRHLSSPRLHLPPRGRARGAKPRWRRVGPPPTTTTSRLVEDAHRFGRAAPVPDRAERELERRGSTAEKPFQRVSRRLAAFFGDPAPEVDVLSLHLFDMGRRICRRSAPDRDPRGRSVSF